jgi:hypothetical protein
MIVLVAWTLSQSAEAKPKVVAPTYAVGWNAIGAAGGQCYLPPDYATLGPGDRRIAWNSARNAMMEQWTGQKGDGFTVEPQVSEAVETALLAKPERVEQVSKDNFEKCKAAFQSGGMSAWTGWLSGLNAQLTAGECPNPPLDYTLYDYLSINSGWQIPAGVCKGDRVLITASEADYYQIVPNGTWINASGDPAGGKPTTSGFPCDVEGCKPGILTMKFVGASGTTVVVPVGLRSEFLVPEHGRISVMINDDNLSDNKYKVESRLEHHTQIEYGPAK